MTRSARHAVRAGKSFADIEAFGDTELEPALEEASSGAEHLPVHSFSSAQERREFE